MPIGVCRFCGKEKELINSHIIPKCLLRIAEGGGLAGVDVKNQRIDQSASQQNGIKEPIMCAECDTALGKLDGYANKILNKVVPKLPTQDFMGVPARRLKSTEFDCEKLRKFFISLLWRSGVSAHGPKLGKYENIALKILKGEIPDDKELFLPLIYKKMTGIPLVDETTFCGGRRYLRKHTTILRFPGYEVIIVINPKHSSNDELMKLHKMHFDDEGIWIVEMTERTPTDNKLIREFIDCQKSLFNTKEGKKRLSAKNK